MASNAQELAEFRSLFPGDRLHVTTLLGIAYVIEVSDDQDGGTLVHRHVLKSEHLNVAAETFDNVTIIGGHGVGILAVGESMRVSGTSAVTNMKISFETTALSAIEEHQQYATAGN